MKTKNKSGMKIKFTAYIYPFFMAISTLSLVADGGLILNGSFEEETGLDHDIIMQQYQNDYMEKGFEFNFDRKRWAARWIINGVTAPATISLPEDDSAPEGNRYLRVGSTEPTHIYSQELVSASHDYKGSFFARKSDKSNDAEILVFAYLYSHSEWSENKLLATIYLEDEWKEHEFELPAQVDGAVHFRLGLAFVGGCDLDKVVLEEK